MRPLDYHGRFWEEAARYFRWYEVRQAGLGDDFFDEVGRALGEIEADPSRYVLTTATSRQHLVSRYPFSIFYRVKSDRVRVLALWHNARGSSAWKWRR